MTNPDNVGGQYDRELIALMLEVYASTHEAPMWPLHRESTIREQVKLLRDADSAEAARVRTLSRAAPAGGDDWPFVEEIGTNGKPTGYWIRKGSPAAARMSAPAGSGEVEQMAKRLDDARAIEEETSGLEDTIDAMRTAAALLRKLQQGADGWRPISEYRRDGYFGGYVLTWKHGFTPVVARYDDSGWWTPDGLHVRDPEMFSRIPDATACEEDGK